MSVAEENELIREAQAGDRRAFSVLVEAHYKMMFKTAWQWCGVREDAEDIAQEAAIKLAHNIGAFRFESAFSTWLYRMVINTAKDYYKSKNRRNTRETPIYEDMQYASFEATPEERLEHKDILKALNGLPDQLKETVILVCWQGMSHKQAGEVLECSEGTISWRVHEARKKIAEFMGEKAKKAGMKIKMFFGLMLLALPVIPAKAGGSDNGFSFTVTRHE